MINPKKKIRISVIYEGETHDVETYPNEYRSLMMLIYDLLSPDGFGDCLGMGKCGTCLIEINNDINLTSYNRNEETTLLKAGNAKGLRLACQILIDEHIDGLVVTVAKI